MISYVPGVSPVHRAHPYTPLAAAAALLLVTFTVPGPAGAWLMVALALGSALLAGVTRHIARPALVLILPTWLVIFVLHGLLGDDPRIVVAGITLSEPGLARAAVLAGRLAAIVIASLVVLTSVSPARLVDAMTDRGVPFGRTFLLVSTLTFLPRTRARAQGILAAQQCRGLRLGGSPLARLRALGPLVLPLVLGALSEVDEQVLALESRGATTRGRRTALEPPPDSAAQRALRWGLLLVVAGAFALRFGVVS